MKPNKSAQHPTYSVQMGNNLVLILCYGKQVTQEAYLETIIVYKLTFKAWSEYKKVLCKIVTVLVFLQKYQIHHSPRFAGNVESKHVLD